MQRRSDKHKTDNGDNGHQTPERVCDWQGCGERGEYRAPKSREELTTYLWFCLDHIRDYNKSWNYYDGMDDEQVENDLRHDTVWNRPTWQLGAGAFGFGEKADPFHLFGADENPSEKQNGPCARPPVSKEEEHAYRTLGLEYPASSEDIKVRYKALVKEHHPDTNKGAPEAEERLKQINQAYHILCDARVA